MARTQRVPAIELVDKYRGYGWSIHIRPRGGINDFVALKDDKMHFIQLIGDRNAARFNGEQRGSFIQNAFSNGAVPIYAEMAQRGISLSDANTGSRVIIGRNQAETPPAEEKNI